MKKPGPTKDELQRRVRILSQRLREAEALMGANCSPADGSPAGHPEPQRLDDRVQSLLEKLAAANEELQCQTEELQAQREDLLLAKEEWERTFDAVPDLIAILDKQHRIVRVNRPMAQALGQQAEEMKGKFCYELMHKTACPPEVCPHSRLIRDGESHSAELEELGRSFLVTVSPVYDDKGDLVASVHVARDITERKRAEDIIKARLRLLKFAESHSLEEFTQAALDESEALTGSRIGFYHLLEADQHTLLLQSWSTNTLQNMCTAAGRGKHYDIAEAGVWVDAVHQRQPVIHNNFQALPHRKGMPPGHAPVVRELVVPIFRDEKIVAVIGVGNKASDYDEKDVEAVSLLGDLAWEIAERKRAEEALRRAHAGLERQVRERTASLRQTVQSLEAEMLVRMTAEAALKSERQRFYDVLERLPASILLLTPDFQVSFANRYFVERFGEPQGRRCFEFLFGRQVVCGNCGVSRALETGEPEKWEWTGPDGRLYEQYTYPFTDADGSPLILERGQDITEQRQAEEEVRKLNEELDQRVKERTAQLEAASREMEAFAYSVSHDLKAPIRAIDGFSRLLILEKSDQLDEEGLRLLKVVRSNTEFMARLIDDLLALSRLGRQQLRKVRIDLAAMCASVIKEIQAQDPGRRLKVTIKDLPPARGDTLLMRQVLANLLANAFKFSKFKEETVIEVGWWSEAGQDVYYVKDNGIGFDMRYRDKLFGVFQRLHPVGEFEGTGVGLAIVQRIMQRHGGRVWAEGEVNKGATFFFTLPAGAKVNNQ